MHYYESRVCALKIYNLIVPILLVTFTGLVSVLIPAQEEGRLNMGLTVVLTFIFLQTLIAAMSPKTPSSPEVRYMRTFIIHTRES